MLKPWHLTVLLMLLATDASARVEFTLVHNGRPLRGGEVCFYPSSPAAADLHPSAYWFYTNDVRCHSADMLFDLPAGRLHYFVRHKDGLISRFKASVVSAPPTSPDGYRRVVDEVYPATTVDITELRKSLGSGEWLAFVTEDSEQNVGMVYPVPTGATSVLLPLNWPLLPLVIRDQMPVRAGTRTILTAEKPPDIRFDPPAVGTGDVLTWIDVDSQQFPAHIRSDKIGRFAISLRHGNTEHPPVLRTLHPRMAYTVLQVFKGIPAGPAIIRLSGRLWQTYDLPVIVKPGSLQVTEQPLRASLGSALRITYAIPASAVPVSAAGSTTCEAGAADYSASVTLHRCTNVTDAVANELRDCTLVRKSDISQDEAADMPGLTPGGYVVETRDSALGITRRAVTLQPLEDVAVQIEPYAFPLFGTVTHRGKPVRALLTFAAGSRFERTTVTDAAGRYRTILGGDPRNAGIDVAMCDGSFTVIVNPEAPLTPNQTYDIVLPGAAVTVTVHDDAGRPIPDARTRILNHRTDGSGIQSISQARSNETGIAHYASVLHKSPIQVCAAKVGFRSTCLEKTELQENEHRRVRITLTSGGLTRGRLAPANAFTHARMFWVDPAGHETEAVRVEPDGSFQLARSHSENEYVVLVSPNQPLFVIERWRRTPEGEVLIEVPLGAPSRSFQVGMAPSAPAGSRYCTIAVGNRFVPTDVFGFHEMIRGVDPIVTPAMPLQVRDIAATGQITVILGPSREEVPPGLDPKNFYAQPQFIPIVRKLPVPDTADSVRFE
ncbi:MAG TPA: hypothetical protein VFL80_12815 [Thermoanaerobaculia bacterium]|nr:hypothetical protein [Thermoanaerobaculia bacterium]